MKRLAIIIPAVAMLMCALLMVAWAYSTRSGSPVFAALGAPGLTLTIRIPAGCSTAANNLAFITAQSSAGGGGFAWGTAPATTNGSFSVVANTTQVASAPSVITYARVLVAGDPNQNVTITANVSGAISAAAFCYANSTVDTANVQRTGGSVTTVTFPSLTAAGANELLLLVGNINGGSGGWNAPSVGTTWASNANGGGSFSLSDYQLPGSGATGSQTITYTNAHTNDGTAIALIQAAATPTPTPTATPTPECANLDGNPTFVTVASAATPAVTFPASAHAGSQGLVCAVSTVVGSFGAAPTGWAAVSGTDQHTGGPSGICYSKSLVGGDLGQPVTLNAPGSGSNTLVAYAISGSGGIDTAAVQRNPIPTGTPTPAPSSTVPGITPNQSGDLLINLYAMNPGATQTCDQPGNGTSTIGVAQTFWAQGTSACLYSMILSGAPVATGTMTTAISTSKSSDGFSVGFIRSCNPPNDVGSGGVVD